MTVSCWYTVEWLLLSLYYHHVSSILCCNNHLSCDSQNITQCTYIITITTLTVFFIQNLPKIQWFYKAQANHHAHVSLRETHFTLISHYNTLVFFSSEFASTWNSHEEKKFEIHVNSTCNSHVIFYVNFTFTARIKLIFMWIIASVPWSTFHD